MSDYNGSRQDSKSAASTLDRLAVSLGYSTEAFLDPALTEEGQNLEFLRLWLTIEDEQDRVKVLTLLRSLTGNMPVPGEPVAPAHAMQKPDLEL